MAVIDKLHEVSPEDGLFPTKISQGRGVPLNSAPITFGGIGDSFYEYLLKVRGCTGGR
jgi:mannosyl-oligosaccharide alpha-1,2-mannosidase